MLSFSTSPVTSVLFQIFTFQYLTFMFFLCTLCDEKEKFFSMLYNKQSWLTGYGVSNASFAFCVCCVNHCGFMVLKALERKV